MNYNYALWKLESPSLGPKLVGVAGNEFISNTIMITLNIVHETYQKN